MQLETMMVKQFYNWWYCICVVTGYCTLCWDVHLLHCFIFQYWYLNLTTTDLLQHAALTANIVDMVTLSTI